MKALTISQPFASLITNGEKWVENRSWETKYRGSLAIHAGKGTQYLTAKQLENHVTVAIVATCELVACVNRIAPTTAQRNELERYYRWDDFLLHKHAEGPWCWVLHEVRPAVQPVGINGKQGLWDVPEDVLRDSIDALGF